MSRAPRHIFAILAGALLFANLAAEPALADHARWRDRGPRSDQDAAREGVHNGRLLPLGEVLARIRARYRGEMIGSAQLQEISPGVSVYRIMWLTPEGRRLDIVVDARTGEILSVSG